MNTSSAERRRQSMKGGDPMRVLVIGSMLLTMISLSGGRAGAADESKVKAATGHVETGARKIGDGKIGEGVEETAKGIGNTVVEGGKFSGQKLQEAGKAAGPQAKGAGEQVRDGAVSFGQSVKTFVKRMFGN
jgi:hypothetical protein